MDNNLKQESLIIKFEGGAVKEHAIPVSSFIETLSGLEKLSCKTIEKYYEKKTRVDVKVTSLRPGSFIFDLILSYAEPIRATVENVNLISETIISVINLGKFLMGKKAVEQKACEGDLNQTAITNCNGQVQVFNNSTINIWSDGSVRSALNKTTSSLDKDGFDSIRVQSGTKTSFVNKNERPYFYDNQHEILNENESNIILEITELSLSGSNKKWRFFDGDIEFYAVIEDETFLTDVKNKAYSFTNGTQLDVILRTVQKKNNSRITTERSIIEVKKVIQPN